MSNKNIQKLAMPSAAKLIEEKKLDINNIIGTGVDGRVTKGDVLLHLNLINNTKLDEKISNSNNNILKGKENGMDVLVPVLGESVVEATVSKWIKKQGDYVEVDDPIVELETDKVTLEVPASTSGILENTVVSEGDTVEVGALLGTIIAGAKQDKKEEVSEEVKVKDVEKEKPTINKLETKSSDQVIENTRNEDNANLEERIPMSRLRQAIARRLKEAQNTAAMLTTYNEVDMSALMEMRKNYQESFEKKNGVRLGYMSFFVKASIDALNQFPAVNAEIDGNDIIYKNYYDVGVAVGTPQGLVVPIVRDADKLTFAEIESTIADFGRRARDGKLTIQEMTGGTFTISNGGVYGSLMSMPILNPPQSGILGMHTIQKRPIVTGDQIEIASMMYLALSYDHRIVDGREAVTFLVRMKEVLEDPQRLLIDV